jgi:hypothetical protein
MSTQSYTTHPGTINQQVTAPSRPRRWILVAGAAVAALFVALVLILVHTHSSVAPAGNGTSVPSHSQTVNPAVPVRPTVNPAVPSQPVVNPAVPATPAS